MFDPLQYLPLLTHRPGASDYAKPLRQWRATWPPVYHQVLSQLRKEWPEGRGVRECIQSWQVHTQHEAGLIEHAISQALAYRCVHYEGVRLCLTRHVCRWIYLARLHQPDAQPVDWQQYDRLIGHVYVSETTALLATYLRELRLPTMLRTYRQVAQDAAQAQLGYDAFLLAV
jgi:hypothetical protein